MTHANHLQLRRRLLNDIGNIVRGIEGLMSYNYQTSVGLVDLKANKLRKEGQKADNLEEVSALSSRKV